MHPAGVTCFVLLKLLEIIDNMEIDNLPIEEIIYYQIILIKIDMIELPNQKVIVEIFKRILAQLTNMIYNRINEFLFF